MLYEIKYVCRVKEQTDRTLNKDIWVLVNKKNPVDLIIEIYFILNYIFRNMYTYICMYISYSYVKLTWWYVNNVYEIVVWIYSSVKMILRIDNIILIHFILYTYTLLTFTFQNIGIYVCIVYIYYKWLTKLIFNIIKYFQIRWWWN